MISHSQLSGDVSSELEVYAQKNQSAYNQFWLEHDKLDLRHSTKFLAYRDLFQLIDTYLLKTNAKTTCRVLDYGCGNGEIAQLITEMFLKSGVNVELHCLDKNKQNLEMAKTRNPNATFHLVHENSDCSALKEFDLVICSFVLLENLQAVMQSILGNIQAALSDNGISILIHNTAKVYDETNNWVSFSTKFAENKRDFHDDQKNKDTRTDGKPVKKAMLDTNGNTRFTFSDFFYRRCTYKSAFTQANLVLVTTHKPLGKIEDGVNWQSETQVAPYRLDILRKAPTTQLQQSLRP